MRKVICILIIIVSLGIIAYPFVAEKINSKKQEEIILQEQGAVADADEATLSSALAAARRYNQALVSGDFTADLNEYNSLLNLSGTGVMSFIEIPCIEVKLAIYHGCDDSVLSKGVGHIYGTSLPVGGKGTHTFISGHTGMNNQKMFTDLELVDIGDIFYLNTLGEKYAYQVESINVVDPFAEGVIRTANADEDKATLITCTPYGVNSHRLIVTGERVMLSEKETEVIENNKPVKTKGSAWSEQYAKAIFAGVSVFLFILAVYFVYQRIIRRKK